MAAALLRPGCVPARDVLMGVVYVELFKGNDKAFYRFVSFVLALCIVILCFGLPYQTAQAVVGLTAGVVAIIVSALAAMGISFAMTGGYSTLTDWLDTQITESGADFSGVQYGVNGMGNLLLSNRFVLAIGALAAYIRAQLNLTDNSSVVISEGDVTIGDIQMYGGLQGQCVDQTSSNQANGVSWRIVSGNPLHCVRFDGNYYHFVFWSTSTFDLQISNFSKLSSPVWNNTVLTASQTDVNFYYQVFSLSPSRYTLPEYVKYNYSLSDLLDILNGHTIVSGERLVCNAGTLDIPSDYDIGTLNGVLSIPVPWGLTMPQVLDQVPDLAIADELAGAAGLELVPADDIAGQIDQAATNAPSVSDNPNDYTVPGLQNVFPFCIPFDIYNLLSALAADPVAPAFSWRFYVPGIVDQQISIDLSPFDSVAQVLRTVELLAFIIGLAMVTRERFLRG